jgi:glycosyltransferase involved in cell wall biosynthesis
MERKIFIHAISIHQGGGKKLLNTLLLSASEELILNVDDRMTLDPNINKKIIINRVKPTLFGRLCSEIKLFRSARECDIVLCFGNLPPIFRLLSYTFVFLQNRYLIDDVSLKGFEFKTKFRLILERIWFYSKISNVDKFIIQTPTMRRLLENKINKSIPIEILPFIAKPNEFPRDLNSLIVYDKKFDFVYVASGEPHKNHRRLIEAWCLLAKEGIFPSLCLTLDKSRFSELCTFISDMRRMYGVKIINIGVLSNSEVFNLYSNSIAAIYPSLLESFGLPLIEARQLGLPVVASELDFVRDLIDPDQVFDPKSPTSIARAVKRFIRFKEPPLELLDAKDFWTSIFRKDVL